MFIFPDYILTLVIRSMLMLSGGVLIHICMDYNLKGEAALFTAFWIQSIHRLIKWASLHHVGGFNGQSGPIFQLMNSDIVNFSVDFIWVIAILYFLYQLKHSKRHVK